jgi:hypothetical protein
MGPGTVALVKALQVGLALPVTGFVDSGTVEAINNKLASLPSDQRVVEVQSGTPMATRSATNERVT